MRTVFLALLVAFLANFVAAYEGLSVPVRRATKLTSNPTDLLTKRLTNAQRLARGLNLAPPKFSSGRHLAGRAGPSATPTTSSTDTPTSIASTIPSPPTSSSFPTSSSSSDTSATVSSSDATTSTATTDTTVSTNTDTATSAVTSASAVTTSGTGTATGTSSTPTCTAYTGLLSITGGSYTGYYVSSSANTEGEYSITNVASQALQVQYTGCNGAASYGPLSLRTLNGFSSYPYLGAIETVVGGTSNLAAGSSRYAWIGGTPESDAGALPQSGENSFSAATRESADWESAIWTIDSSTNEVSSRWINTDGSQHSTAILFVEQFLVMTGDATIFKAYYGAGLQVLTLTFVEESSSPVSASTTTVIE